jgi:hypothetical protein
VEPRLGFNWGAMDKVTLIKCYDEIRKHLPATSLKQMNLEEEIMLQLHNVRALQTDVQDDDLIPLNQRVAAMKSVTDSLNRLAELQDKIYSSERFKSVENMMIRALMLLPEETARHFLDQYESSLLRGRVEMPRKDDDSCQGDPE